MTRVPMIEEIKRDVLRAYGSLEKPTFEFEREHQRQRLYEPFLRDLAAILLLDVLGFYKIANVTDVNSDHGFVFTIQNGGEWWLQLSFVGCYAVLMRLTERGVLEVVDPDSTKNSLIENQIIRLLTNHGVSLLGEEHLETPIGLKLFDTEPRNVRVYQALFSDRDMLPWHRLA
jgi:hypothetical protein